MAEVEIRDRSIWTKHIVGDPALARRLERLEEGRTIKLRVAGRTGVWEKMRRGPMGVPTPGLKPVGEMRAVWAELYESRRRQFVEIAAVEEEAPPAAPPSATLPIANDWKDASAAERDAAWSAFRALTRAGWRSEEPSSGDRDELHQR